MALTNPIEQFFRSEGSKISKFSELFKGNDDFIDQMSEVNANEIRMLVTLHETDRFLLDNGLRSPVYASYANKFLRLMVSKDRKSRAEYVDVHKAEEQRLKLTGEGLKLP